MSLATEIAIGFGLLVLLGMFIHSALLDIRHLLGRIAANTDK
jgi:hypothetical protein